MKILHVTSITNLDGNGVAVAVNNYAMYEKKHEKVALFNLEGPIKLENCLSYSYCDYKKIEDLPEPFCNPDLVIFNEVYKPKYIDLYKECLKRNINYIIIPHGCLVKEAQKKRKIKKIIGNVLLFNRFIRNANAIQFLNENEKMNSNFKYKKSIIAGNGIEKMKHKNKYQNKNLVFIGRYSIKHKGLDLLIDICYRHKKWFIDNNIKIQLYGRDSGNQLELLKKMVKEKQIEETLIVNGPVYKQDKIKVLEDAYCFIQCSRYEGQPMGIIEALSIGLPCIVTYGTYLGEYINTNKCGIACNFDSEEVFNAISNLINDNEMRDKFADNAYKKSNIDFCWDNIIEETIDEYRKIR